MIFSKEFDAGRWAEVVRRIKIGDRAATEELYEAMRDGFRPRLSRIVGAQSAEDGLHEVLVIVLDAIRRDELTDPRRLMGFVRTVVQRRIVAHIRDIAAQRRRFVSVGLNEKAQKSDAESPEALVERRERVERAMVLLRKLNARDREILERFFWLEQNADQICRAMRLTATQFRLFKSRALTRVLQDAVEQSSGLE